MVMWIPGWSPGGCKRERGGPVAVHSPAWGSLQVARWGVLPASGSRRWPPPCQLPLQVHHRCCTHQGTAGTHPVYVPSSLFVCIPCPLSFSTGLITAGVVKAREVTAFQFSSVQFSVTCLSCKGQCQSGTVQKSESEKEKKRVPGTGFCFERRECVARFFFL